MQRWLHSLGLISIGALVSGAAWAQSPAPAAANAVRVVFICPFTGGSQDFGNSARLGAELAVKEINEVGGFLGRPVELLSRDDKAQPDEGRRIAEELVLKASFACRCETRCRPRSWSMTSSSAATRRSRCSPTRPAMARAA